MYDKTDKIASKAKAGIKLPVTSAMVPTIMFTKAHPAKYPAMLNEFIRVKSFLPYSPGNIRDGRLLLGLAVDENTKLAMTSQATCMPAHMLVAIIPNVNPPKVIA